MSLARLAFRLATLEALCPSASLDLPQWQPLTAYALGVLAWNDDPTYGALIYKTTMAGTSASSGGPTGIQPVAAWNNATAYTAGQQSAAAGLVWTAAVNNTGVMPGTDPTKWTPAQPTPIVDGSVQWKFLAPLFPTVAGKTFFDTRIGPLDDLTATDRKPIGVVYTEEDHSVETGQKAGGPPFKREVTLLIELSIAAQLPDGENSFAPGVPYTDAELETSLDVFEAQVRYALFYGPTGKLWRDLTALRVTDVHSSPKRTSEESAPLAQRLMTIKAVIPDDDFSAVPTSQPAGADRLPDPLKSVVSALASGAYAGKIAAGLTPSIPVLPTRVPLQTVALDIQVASPPGPLDAGLPQINASVDLPQG